MFKAKAKTKIVDGDKIYDIGEEIIVTKEQLVFLAPYLEDIQEVEKEDKPSQASSKAKAKK